MQSAIIRLSRLAPQSLRTALASSSYGNWARNILNRASGDLHPIVRPIGPLSGQRMRVNWALHKTYVFGTHEPEVMRALRRVVQPGWTAIDVGANIGYSTLILAKRTGPTGKVIAFEPLSENFELLQENIRLNDYRSVVAEKLALMDRAGHVELHSATPGAMTWVASASISPDTAVESQGVEAITLDQYVRRENIAKIDFVKMDVEGAEASVIEGMTETLTRDKPILVIELHNFDRYGENHPALLKLKERNYKVTSLGTRNWELHVLAEAGGPRNLHDGEPREAH